MESEQEPGSGRRWSRVLPHGGGLRFGVFPTEQDHPPACPPPIQAPGSQRLERPAWPPAGWAVGRAPHSPLTYQDYFLSPGFLSVQAARVLVAQLPASDGSELPSLLGDAVSEAPGLGWGPGLSWSPAACSQREPHILFPILHWVRHGGPAGQRHPRTLPSSLLGALGEEHCRVVKARLGTLATGTGHSSGCDCW